MPAAGDSAPDKLFETEAPSAAAVAYALVAIDQRGVDSAEGGLLYAIPAELADLDVGERVTVPLGRGNKQAGGYIIDRQDEPPADAGRYRIKPITARDDARVTLTRDLVDLARWIASYYCCPLGMVFGSMLPAPVRRGTGVEVKRMCLLSDAGRDQLSAGSDAAAEAASKPAKRKPSKLQRAVLETLAASSGPLEMRTLADKAGAKTLGPVKQLVEKGLIRIRREEQIGGDLDLRAQQVAEPPKDIRLMPEQEKALQHLAGHLDKGFSVHLLHGVTGSGKTEVYLQLIERLRAGAPADDQPAALILVPEIALTPQTVGRFLTRFEDVAVMHSGLTAAQRHAQWRMIRDGRARVVVGARSAIFAPVARPSLIIVDEEHESSYKQDQLPRYHARDVAIRRAQLAGCPVLLGSATPSLESYWNAGGETADGQTGRKPGWHLLHMRQRPGGAKLPDVELVDLQEERRKRFEYSGKAGVHLLSIRLEKVLQETLADGGQAVVLLNRRGYANYIACADHRCGWMMQCEHCDATMVYHVNRKLPTGGLLRCHHCEAEVLLPELCPDCGKQVTVFGLGTQRVEEEIERKFPGTRCLRMDGDTMKSGRDYRKALDRFRAGQAEVLLGTQMIAKGLDVPNVRLVGVISADTSLHMPDFRAAERTFQLVAQVAGRAGRAEHPGRVIVQTFCPDDLAIQRAAAHDFEGFAAEELASRVEVGLPPAARVVRIVLRDRDHLACAARATELAGQLRRAVEGLDAQVMVQGPITPAIARLADHYRQQITLVSPSPAALQRVLQHMRGQVGLTSNAQTAIDVDPVAMV